MAFSISYTLLVRLRYPLIARRLKVCATAGGSETGRLVNHLPPGRGYLYYSPAASRFPCRLLLNLLNLPPCQPPRPTA